MRRAVIVSFVALVGCNGVLGWDAATLDPRLDQTDGSTDTTIGLDCESYCTLMDANCVGTNLKYITHDVCKKMCDVSAFESGAPNDTKGNSLACRITFAQRAGTQTGNDQVASCDNAGPLGGDNCVPDPDFATLGRCAVFCDLTTLYCTSTRLTTTDPAAPPPPYATSEECVADCAPEAGTGYAYTPGESISTDQDRNTLNCRLYHLESAYVDNNAAVAHCKHAQKASVTCVP